MPQVTPSKSGIFLSYRRDDSAGHAGRLYDSLIRHFGEDRIFMDVDTIEPGEDFVEVIESAVASCEVLIALIGRQWLSKPDENTSLLKNRNDFVRIEIAAALERNIRVIPVLVQRATMPSPTDLPEDLSSFCRRNAFELSDYRWQFDVQELITAVEAGILESTKERRPAPSRINKRTILIAGIGGVALIIMIAAFIFMQGNSPAAEGQATAQKVIEGSGASAQNAIPPAPPEMVYVPGAEFQMGYDPNTPSQTGLVTTTLEPFFLDIYEVTCEQYKRFLDSNPNQVEPPDWKNRNYPTGWARKPVTGVNWDQASAFAVWSGKRLPTEEEWEYAARGTDGRLYPWGNIWKTGHANTGKPEAGYLDGARGMAEVGSHKGISPFGAYDMIGNAWEWTNSVFKDSAADRAQSVSQSSQDLKVIRGGSWASRNDQATALFRRGYGARGEERGYSYTGFRLVQDINGPANR